MQDVTLFFFHHMILFIRKIVSYFQGYFKLKLTILHIRIVEVHGGSKVTDLLVTTSVILHIRFTIHKSDIFKQNIATRKYVALQKR